MVTNLVIQKRQKFYMRGKKFLLVIFNYFACSINFDYVLVTFFCRSQIIIFYCFKMTTAIFFLEKLFDFEICNVRLTF